MNFKTVKISSEPDNTITMRLPRIQNYIKTVSIKANANVKYFTLYCGDDILYLRNVSKSKNFIVDLDTTTTKILLSWFHDLTIKIVFEDMKDYNVKCEATMNMGECEKDYVSIHYHGPIWFTFKDGNVIETEDPYNNKLTWCYYKSLINIEVNDYHVHISHQKETIE